jgi:hypothetical protein
LAAAPSTRFSQIEIPASNRKAIGSSERDGCFPALAMARLAARTRSHGHAIAFSELIYTEASMLSRRDHQGAPTIQ